MYKPINERNVYNIFTQKLLTRDHLYCYNRRAVMCVCVKESECIENTKPDLFFLWFFMVHRSLLVVHQSIYVHKFIVLLILNKTSLTYFLSTCTDTIVSFKFEFH